MAALTRSYLYVPGNAGDKIAKALGRGADALILDLEDAVPHAEKDAALDAVVTWLEQQPAAGAVEVWVRINSGERGLNDAERLVGLPGLTGLALAKADAQAVEAVAARLDELGDRDLVLMPLIETCDAVLDARAIAAAPRVHQIQIGEADLTADAGLDPGEDEVELLAIRTTVVLASSAAGILPPVGPVSRITADPQRLEESTRRVARLGFVGRACIHPAQVPVVHQVFTPTAAQVEEAQETLALQEESESRGSGVSLDGHGRLVDPAVVRSAERVLALHERATSR